MGFLEELEESLAVEQNTAVQSEPVLTIQTIKPVQEAGALRIHFEATKRKRTMSANPTEKKRTSQGTEARQKSNQDRGASIHVGSATPTTGPIGVQKKITEASASDKHSTASGYMQQLLKHCLPLEVVREYTPSIDKMSKSMQEIASLPIEELESAYDQLAAFMSGFVYTLKEKQIYQREGLQKVIDKRTAEIEFLNKQLQEAQNPVGRKGKEAFHDILLPEEEEALRVTESERDSFKERVEELEGIFKESDEVRSRLELAWSANDRLKTKLFFHEDTAKKKLNRLKVMNDDLISANQEQRSKIQDLLDANEELSSKVEALDEECKRINALMERQKTDSKRLNSEGFSKFMASQKVDRIMKLFFLNVHRHGPRVGAAKATDNVKARFPELDVPLIDFSNDMQFRGRAGVEEFKEDIPNLSGEFSSFLNSFALEPTNQIGKPSQFCEQASAADEEHATGNI